ncbi:MAG: acyl-CoA thioesterase [Planctomycetes bacterium]|nr:acyl-CoA thioesterase [Planctomycetota bacterium]
MPAVFEFEHTVAAEEIDDHGHANNVCFVAWMQAAAIAHSSAQGWSPERCRDHGIAWVARSHTVEYHAPAFAGERLVVRTWIADFQKVSSRRRYRIVRISDGRLLATAETNWALIDPSTGRPRRIPPEVLHAFEPVADHGSAP